MTGCSVTHNMDETPDEFIGGIKDINRTRKLGKSNAWRQLQFCIGLYFGYANSYYFFNYTFDFITIKINMNEIINASK